jgi:hypothetical protein
MDVIMTAFMDNHQVSILAVIMIAVYVMEVYFLIIKKFSPAMSTSMVLFSE